MWLRHHHFNSSGIQPQYFIDADEDEPIAAIELYTFLSITIPFV